MHKLPERGGGGGGNLGNARKKTFLFSGVVLLVVPDRRTMSPIELFWTAKNQSRLSVKDT